MKKLAVVLIVSDFIFTVLAYFLFMNSISKALFLGFTFGLFRSVVLFVVFSPVILFNNKKAWCFAILSIFFLSVLLAFYWLRSEPDVEKSVFSKIHIFPFIIANILIIFLSIVSRIKSRNS
ncbi:hypothetical protein OB69_03640 [Roseivirga seohaensis subsp. aquiponti]|uniref:Uncharacterized protein n=1 Tax=Roseivirga seohaensis subsp. aquiponti TaxID=1566026 RepID=A0A0L8APD0_9BACT|nr:hypothetical protein OB69_03640 [Roseivirga seohaensis subsp. aquiponti]